MESLQKAVKGYEEVLKDCWKESQLLDKVYQFQNDDKEKLYEGAKGQSVDKGIFHFIKELI